MSPLATLSAQQTPPADPPAATASPPAATPDNTGGRPAYVPAEHWDEAGKKVKDEAAFAKFVNDHVAFKAADDSRRATLPKEGDYKIELPAELVIPQGVEFKLKPDDPAYGHLRKLASEVGLTQEQFGKAIGIYASQLIGQQQRLQTAMAAEVQKMGPTASTRVTAIETFLNAKLGTDLAAPLIRSMVTETSVRAYEKIMQLVTGQGAADFNSSHREPPGDGNGKIAGYEGMSFLQRRAAQDAARQKGAR